MISILLVACLRQLKHEAQLPKSYKIFAYVPPLLTGVKAVLPWGVICLNEGLASFRKSNWSQLFVVMKDVKFLTHWWLEGKKY